MKAPVSIEVPPVPQIHLPPQRIEAYRQQLFAKLPYAVPQAEALRLLNEREHIIVGSLISEGLEEPVVLRRKIREA